MDLLLWRKELRCFTYSRYLIITHFSFQLSHFSTHYLEMLTVEGRNQRESGRVATLQNVHLPSCRIQPKFLHHTHSMMVLPFFFFFLTEIKVMESPSFWSSFDCLSRFHCLSCIKRNTGMLLLLPQDLSLCSLLSALCSLLSALWSLISDLCSVSLSGYGNEKMQHLGCMSWSLLVCHCKSIFCIPLHIFLHATISAR